MSLDKGTKEEITKKFQLHEKDTGQLMSRSQSSQKGLQNSQNILSSPQKTTAQGWLF